MITEKKRQAPNGLNSITIDPIPVSSQNLKNTGIDQTGDLEFIFIVGKIKHSPVWFLGRNG